MNRKIVYIINPISGTREKSSLPDLLKKKTTEKNIDFEILFSSADGCYDELLRRAKAHLVTDIVICGGDGTVNAAVAALQSAPVNIGIIPMGSGNGLAFAAKIPKQPTKALEIIFANQSAAVDAFYINDHFSCMLCGIGFDASVAHEFARQKKRGLQTYIKITAINYFKARPYPFEIITKEKTISTDAFFICIANGNQFGNNVTIAPQASLSDGLLDVVVVTKMNKFQLPFSLISQVTGINAVQRASDMKQGQHVLYFQTDKLQIKNTGNALLHIDGEPADTAPLFNISIIRNCFRLLQPPK